jgi:penicillin-binding protein 1A
LNPTLRKFAYWGAAAATALALLVPMGIAGAYVYLNPTLPSVEQMRNTELQVPLRIYARSGQLIAQIGEQRRIPVAYEEIPERVRQAFIAAEDDRFFEHSGFDYQGILRSALVNVVPGSNLQGASTITMQTARNLFLTQDRTWRRKLQEVFLTYRIEREFSKEQILGLYLNVISFGKRAYGVAAAAELYFGKTLDQLTLAEAATLARVPQAPSRYNPINNPEAAAQRRGYVLRRMRELGFIDAGTAERAAAEVVVARVHSPAYEVEAPYVAEMARLEFVRRFGNAAQSEGYRVYTTVDTRLQAAANRALRLGLVEYDRRHGWRGAQGQLALQGAEDEALLGAALDEYPVIGPLLPAAVLSVGPRSARLFVKGAGFRTLDWAGMSWARRQDGDRLGPAPKAAKEIVTRGNVVYVVAGESAAQLVQVPEAEAALVALDPQDGALAALVGGFDYFDKGLGKFNRAIQARRQPGSAFKPFLYSAALEHGFTASSVIMDAPIVIDGPGMEEAWRPENSSGEFYGPTRLREALVKSRNLVSIRLLQSIGLQPAMRHAERFGFSRKSLPANLTLALGTMPATPLEVATGYAVFANGGFRVAPYFIDRIEDPTGKVVFQAEPRIAAPECEPRAPAPPPTTDPTEPAPEGDGAAAEVAPAGEPAPPPQAAPECSLTKERLAERAISAQNAWLIDSMMAEVITRGTGQRALALGRRDLAGKTGTTNDAKDTWFNGYNPRLVASVWVGFDQERSLGEREEGSRTAVPIWVYFMREALRGVPESRRPMPDGLLQVRISPWSGGIAGIDDPDAIFETFMADRLPSAGDGVDAGGYPGDAGAGGEGSSGGVNPPPSEPLF